MYRRILQWLLTNRTQRVRELLMRPQPLGAHVALHNALHPNYEPETSVEESNKEIWAAIKRLQGGVYSCLSYDLWDRKADPPRWWMRF